MSPIKWIDKYLLGRLGENKYLLEYRFNFCIAKKGGNDTSINSKKSHLHDGFFFPRHWDERKKIWREVKESRVRKTCYFAMTFLFQDQHL